MFSRHAKGLGRNAIEEMAVRVATPLMETQPAARRGVVAGAPGARLLAAGAGAVRRF